MPNEHDMRTLPTPFSFQSADVRTATDERGEVWFCARDVFDALDLSWRGGSGLRGIPEHWKESLYIRSNGGVQETLFICEAAVYRLAFRSHKDEATQFADWVCSEVLPTIRKQGFFGEVPNKDRLGISRQITAITRDLMMCSNAFQQAVLMDELRDLYRMIGRPMPDTALVAQKAGQIPLIH